MEREVDQILIKAFGQEVSECILDSYKEIQSNYLLRKWKPSELDSGHFVESVRRAVENELFGSYTPIDKQISDFNDSVLIKYENSKGDESFRILIPRILKSIYGIRNKRGVGHIGKISPNEMDSTYILYATKWILSELVRLKSNLSTNETQKLVDKIVERQIEIIWESKNRNKRILDPNMKAEKQILVFLSKENQLSEKELIGMVEYKNPTNFSKILKKLHSKRLIEYGDNMCEITTRGIIEAENIILTTKQKI